MPAPKAEWTDDLIDSVIDLMEQGETLTAISQRRGMPSASTLWRWENAGDELSERITRARDLGYITRAEKAVEKAQKAENPVKARLAFDADRWFIGKMCPKRFGDSSKLMLADAHGEKIELDETAKLTRLASLVAQIRGDDEPSDDAG